MVSSLYLTYLHSRFHVKNEPCVTVRFGKQDMTIALYPLNHSVRVNNNISYNFHYPQGFTQMLVLAQAVGGFHSPR